MDVAARLRSRLDLHAKRRWRHEIERALRSGETVEALRLCQRAAERFDDGDPEYDMAIVLIHSDEPHAASRALETALARSPQLVLEVQLDPRFDDVRAEPTLAVAMQRAHARMRVTS